MLYICLYDRGRQRLSRKYERIICLFEVQRTASKLMCSTDHGTCNIFLKAKRETVFDCCLFCFKSLDMCQVNDIIVSCITKLVA